MTQKYNRDRVLEMASLAQLTYLAHKHDTEMVKEILTSGSPGLVQKYEAIAFLKAPRLFGSPLDLVCCGLIASNDDHTVIAIRGTENLEDYFYGLMVESNSDNIHYGFNFYVESFWKQLIGFLAEENHCQKDIFVTGHSLGGAAAILLSKRLENLGYKPSPPHVLETYVFAAPPVTTGELVLATPVYRFRQKEDFIPHLRELTMSLVEGMPGMKMAIAKLNPDFLPNLEKYSHIGKEYVITKDYQVSELQEPEKVNFWQWMDLSRVIMTHFKYNNIGEQGLRKLLRALIDNFFDDHRAIRYVQRLNYGVLPPWWVNLALNKGQ